MTNKKHLFWMDVGTIATFLMGILVTLVIHAITWTPLLIEIASVTWNDTPVI